MPQPKLVAFAGSLRNASLNKKLLAIGVEAARAAGAEVTVIDLKELALPLFDQDLQDASGLPESARNFKRLLIESDGALIASPEYNSSITAALKNAIDWVSRTETDEEPPFRAFKNKVAAIMSASPGPLGGLRGLVALRSMLGNLGMHLIPDQVTVGSAYDVFGEDGKIKDERKAKQVVSLAQRLVEVAGRLKG